ncbi:MAG TPA: ABC transporter substrate-binding protein [Candidatus Limnocylindrales bacterium]|nr:ABC transporter substrate-binding protein [Candidatus Limnocylindrales bacterium]
MADEPSSMPGDPKDTTLSRRRLLINTGVVVGGAILAGPLAACGTSSSTTGPSAAASPKRGGSFRLGVTGGGANDIIDGQNIVTKPDQARLVAGFETLLEYDEDYKLQTTGLAESVTQDAPDQWTIRVKQGITFHDGKTLSADDVIYSLRRILTGSEGLFGNAGLMSVDPNNMTKMDDRTVRLKLKQADSTIADQLGQYYNGVVPVGYTRSGPQNGTGPYKVQSFNKGQQSVHVRNANYWRSGQPYFDQVTVIDFPDPSAQVNALLSGQIDAMTDIPFAQITVVKAHGGLAVLEGNGAGWLPLCMAIDMPPFDNNDVRQAFRLIADRNALLQQVLSGHGRVANDLYSPFDPAFDSSLPQRHQDIAQAKALLKKAGRENMVVDLHTTDGAAGMVDSANVFATQAAAAGVTINVHNDPNYYGDQYLKLAFSVDFWGTRNYLPQVANGSLPTAPYNECHWPPKGSNYVSLYQQALAEVDTGKRADIIHQMQKLEYDQGGYIIPFFNNLVDAYNTKVQGFRVSKATLNLDSFGHGFRTIWFA